MVTYITGIVSLISICALTYLIKFATKEQLQTINSWVDDGRTPDEENIGMIVATLIGLAIPIINIIVIVGGLGVMVFLILFRIGMYINKKITNRM